MPSCSPFDAAAPFAVSLTEYVDCRVEALGREGYLALAMGGSPVMLALGGLVTILVALTGYRLIFGEPLEARDGFLIVLRIGITLGLATQWPAFQALIYNVAIHGPEELVSTIEEPIGGTSQTLTARVQAAYTVLNSLARPTNLPPVPVVPPNMPGAGIPAPVATPALPIEQQRLSLASLALLISALGAQLSVRIAAAFLLALGPLFAACLLFDTLRSLFEGWVRGLAASALGSVAVACVLGIELSIIEPQLALLASAAESGTNVTQLAGETLATTLLFAVILLVTLAIAVRVGAAFRFAAPAFVRRDGTLKTERLMRPSVLAAIPAAPRAASLEITRSRALEIADSIRMIETREQGAGGRRFGRPLEATDRGPAGSIEPRRLGQSYRRTLHRHSAAAAQRDRPA
jgi:type IV secretion system protein VirB6